jgi:small-conductance mechanosensitive channel
MDPFSTGPLGQLIAQFSAFFPKIVGALTILFIGMFVARTIRTVLSKILKKIGIDKIGDMLNEIDMVQRSGMKILFSEVIAKIIYYVMMLLFIIAATEALGVAAITQLVTDVINYLPSLLSAALVFLAGLFVADMIKGAVHTVCTSIGISSAGMISSAVFYFLFITIAISALAQAKINTEFIAANLTVIIGSVAAAFALGYGFASKELMSNYLAGYYNKNKVRVGDDVRIIGMRGKVVMIDSTSLILQTNDRAIVIPLSKLTTEKVEVFYPDPQEENLLEEGNP